MRALTIWLRDHKNSGELVYPTVNQTKIPMVVLNCYRSRDMTGWMADLRKLTEEENLALEVMES